LSQCTVAGSAGSDDDSNVKKQDLIALPHAVAPADAGLDWTQTLDVHFIHDVNGNHSAREWECSTR
jgi:hypothetical protein